VLVRVFREACCAQDDQLGPLDATFDVRSSATIGELVSAIVGSGFLQYSSSHTSLVGSVRGKPFVRVFSSYHAAGRGSEFSVPETELIASVVGDQTIEFRFAAVAPHAA
jgi:hypothetical protein